MFTGISGAPGISGTSRGYTGLVGISGFSGVTLPVSQLTPDDFVRWLDGFLDFNEGKALDERKTCQLKNKLAQVFNKVTPALVKPYPSSNYYPLGIYNDNTIIHTGLSGSFPPPVLITC